MGCVSSSFLEDDDGLGGAGPGLGHHIVSLTSTTYGLLTTLDQPYTQNNPCPPPPPPPPPLPPPTRVTNSNTPRSEPEVINSWELMGGLDPTATPPPRTPLLSLHDIDFRLVSIPSSDPKPKPFSFPLLCPGKENSTSFFRPPPRSFPSDPRRKATVLGPSNAGNMPTKLNCRFLEMFEEKCPPGGENSAVIYTTTLRGIRKTFEECNAVRVALEGLGVQIKERDVSMDLGFREELRALMKGSPNGGATVPRVFVKGRYIGGAEQVLRIHEEGELGRLVEGLPTARAGEACDGCVGVRFLPCFRCSGGRKLVIVAAGGGGRKGEDVVRCPECNENGLVLCPICC